MSSPVDVLDVRRENAVYLNNSEWPERIRMTLKLLASSDPGVVTVGWKTVSFWFGNGKAVYRVDEWDGEALVLSLVESDGPSQIVGKL